jgi:6-phosphogluconolactonase (cycloisomerase 2 family)
MAARVFSNLFSFLNSGRRRMAWRSARLSIAICVTGASLFALSCNGGSPSSGGGPTPPSAKDALYLGSSSGQVLTFVFDTGSGTLGSPTAIAGPASGTDFKIYPGGTFLYVSDFNTGSVYAYSINQSTGALTPVSGSPFSHPSLSGHGGPIAINPAGTYLFVSSASGTIVSFTVNSQTGLLMPNTAASPVNDSNLPGYLIVDSSGKFLIASNHADSAGQNYSVFSINSSTGVLIAVTGSPFTFGQNTQPEQILLNSGNSVLYAALSNSQQVTAINFDANSGRLTAIQGAPYPAGAMPKSIAISASGAFLYAGNTGAGSVSEYAVNASTGVLVTANVFHAGNPSFLDLDSSGQFLLMPGASSGTLQVFKVDSTSGALTPGSTTNLPAGANASVASYLLPLQQ